jgi:hypothetical protein
LCVPKTSSGDDHCQRFANEIRNQTRTNVINRLRIRQDLQAFFNSDARS